MTNIFNDPGKKYMKRIIILSATLIALASGACKKETTITNPVNKQVEGYWPVSYTISSTPGSVNAPEMILFRADGTLRIYIGADTANANKSEGIYNLSDGKLAIRYFHLYDTGIRSVAATLTDKTFTGTWGFDLDPTNGGVWSFTIQ